MSAAEAFMYWDEVEATLCKRGSDVKWLTTNYSAQGGPILRLVPGAWCPMELDRARSALAVLAGGIDSLAFV